MFFAFILHMRCSENSTFRPTPADLSALLHLCVGVVEGVIECWRSSRSWGGQTRSRSRSLWSDADRWCSTVYDRRCQPSARHTLHSTRQCCLLFQMVW